MIPLVCCAKNFAWGKKGTDSAVAQIVKSQNPSYQVEDETPFAELWMGTHPSGPSLVKGSTEKQTLLDYLTRNPNLIGNDQFVSKYNGNLPFLFKILSIRTALSIQAHPNKSLAVKLHANDPTNYPDDNHKPELAIALTQFEAFCGFKLHSEIEFLLNAVPEFRNIVGEQSANGYLTCSTENKKHALFKLFTALMTASGEVVKENLTVLNARWIKAESDPKLEALRNLFLRLSADFPDDIGLFSIFFLNYLVLQPGEAIYLGPNEPHAYISGDCVECMACSDNVVRAGLTPKFKDVQTLCSMLTYNSSAPTDQLLKPIQLDRFTRSYVVPMPEFMVDAIEVADGDVTPSFEYTLEAKESGSILIVIRGDATGGDDTQLSDGYVGFIPASTQLRISNVKSSSLLLYRAYCRLD